MVILAYLMVNLVLHEPTYRGFSGFCSTSDGALKLGETLYKLKVFLNWAERLHATRPSFSELQTSYILEPALNLSVSGNLPLAHQTKWLQLRHCRSHKARTSPLMFTSNLVTDPRDSRLQANLRPHQIHLPKRVRCIATSLSTKLTRFQMIQNMLKLRSHLCKQICHQRPMIHTTPFLRPRMDIKIQ